MEQKNLKLEVLVKERTNKATKHSFNAYAVKMKDGKWYDLSFTKDVPQSSLPKSHSFVFAPATDVNIDNSKKYKRVWVKSIARVEVIERPLEDLTQYFDEED